MAGKRPVRWRLLYDGGTVFVLAVTKSEARSLIKKILGLKRLPPGAKVRKVEE